MRPGNVDQIEKDGQVMSFSTAVALVTAAIATLDKRDRRAFAPAVDLLGSGCVTAARIEQGRIGLSGGHRLADRSKGGQ